jgi:hypothetical protein
MIYFLDIIHHPNFYFLFGQIFVGFLPEDGDKSQVSETLFKIRIT